MNKSELIPAVQKRLQETHGRGFKRDGIQEVLVAAFEIIQEEVANGEKVMWTGFGVFEPYDRRERKAINPRTGEEMFVKARRSPKFTPAKQFKEKVERLSE
jgi:DNA-binding protein HU-beta